MIDNSDMSLTPDDKAYQLIIGFRTSQLVRVAAELGVADLLAAGPLSAADIAERTSLDSSRLRRVLRGLVGLGVLSETEDGRFANTEVGNLFRRGVPGSRRALTMMLLPESYRAWDHLMETVRTGKTGHEIVYGGTLWESLGRDPDYAQPFNDAMVANTELVVEFVASSYDFSRVGLVVDVGGGNGALVGGVLQAYPDLRGVIADVPAGLEGAREYLAQLDVLDRCRLEESDFFASVPKGADVYLLKDILHDWDDDNAVRILCVCRRAAGPGASVLIVERQMPARMDATLPAMGAALTDIQMMVQLGGKERTAGEYRTLLEAAGWRSGRTVVPGAGSHGIVEGVAK